RVKERLELHEGSENGDGDGTPPLVAAPPLPEIEARPARRRRRLALLLGAAALAIAASVAHALHARHYESTDDAFVEAHVIPLSPKVSGHAVRVVVDDNQVVKKGDLLVEIDPRDFAARLAEARARL